MQPVAFIPSPSQGVWHLGPIPIRAYALMIILGIVVAVWLGERRWAAKGGQPGTVIDVAVWAVPFGLVGGRLYHVITDYQRYFGDGKDPVNALKVWEGGLGIWGAVVLGAVGAIIGCRRRGISVLALGDAIAPGIALAQAIGRWGNWWNQELYGRPLHTFWALKIDQAHRPRTADGTLDPKYADVATYHPTFLYESIWCLGVAILVIWAGRRYNLTHGRAFALYIAAYTLGRFWIEALRIDDAHHFAGLRLNDWTSIIVFLGAVGYLYWARNKTGPEAVGRPAPAVADAPVADETVVDDQTAVDERPEVSDADESASGDSAAGESEKATKGDSDGAVSGAEVETTKADAAEAKPASEDAAAADGSSTESSKTQAADASQAEPESETGDASEPEPEAEADDASKTEAEAEADDASDADARVADEADADDVSQADADGAPGAAEDAAVKDEQASEATAEADGPKASEAEDASDEASAEASDTADEAEDRPDDESEAARGNAAEPKAETKSEAETKDEAGTKSEVGVEDEAGTDDGAGAGKGEPVRDAK
ncbi:prolipoprotein diacylglyceryl transferase [Actinomadura rupiterrae]|uniref:prolipoprotein diacylglyceryl transferase n=1 Tax=Actinomadura rupiterrae TaxID=559627 RepID=UPI0020A4E849|nr:prolipoprotein diacylglyceryl transferase [Actinomadura rupiterrae]MCP2338210.1 prolipoprotein diacylglyceryl transferase [Actinomadura rupiterrae]